MAKGLLHILMQTKNNVNIENSGVGYNVLKLLNKKVFLFFL